MDKNRKYRAMLNRQAPHPYEQMILSCFLQRGEYITPHQASAVFSILSENDFSANNRIVFNGIKKRVAQGESCDLVTLQVEDKDIYTNVIKNGLLASDACMPFDLSKKALVLREFSIGEELRLLLIDKLQQVERQGDSVFDVMHDISESVSDLYPNDIQGRVDVGTMLLNQIDIAFKPSEEKEKTFLPTGIMEVDSVIYGYDPGEFVVIGARPGMGKTGFSISQSLAWAQMEVPHVYFSLEMTSQQMINRYISQMTGVGSERLKKNTLTEEEKDKISHYNNALMRLNKFLVLDDKSNATPDYIRAKVKQYISETGAKAVIIDYLQRVSPSRSFDKREREVSEISGALSKVAKDFGITVVCLAQLSRGLEGRMEKRPGLSDLRESGAIEQDAHKVGFLYRPEYYNIDTFEDSTPTDGRAEVIWAKNRDGAIGVARVNFVKTTTAFTSSYGNIW